MTDRTISLRADLVDQLESLAQTEGKTVNEVFGELLERYTPPPTNINLALALAEAMENAPIDWRDEPDASERSREHFERYLTEKWQHTQNSNADNT